MALRLVIIFVLIAVYSSLNAQHQYDTWYFGGKIKSGPGLNFSNGFPPDTLNDGIHIAEEGSAMICDTGGNLLFYTNGMVVINANHDTMQNGDSIGGCWSSVQSAIITPDPGQDSVYYLFTNSGWPSGITNCTDGFDGLYYSVVDMRLNSGLGAVTTKRIHLMDSTSESLTAVKHANCTDYWIITSKSFSTDYYAYKISAAGISEPVISTGGPQIDIAQNTFIKGSPRGSQLAVHFLTMSLGMVNILIDFNKGTGELSNFNVLNNTPFGDWTLGMSFSPNGKILYMSSLSSGTFYLNQFDLTKPNNEIAASKQIIGTLSTDNLVDMQIGPDKKIYIAPYQKRYLDVIHNPNQLGTGCNLQKNAVSLGSRYVYGNLPNLITSYVYDSLLSFSADFSTAGHCEQRGVSFLDNSGADTDYWDWFINDTNGLTLDTIHGASDPAYQFDSSGIYDIKLVSYSRCNKDSVTKRITIDPKANINILASDTVICYGDSVLLTAVSTDSIYWLESSFNIPEQATQQFTLNKESSFEVKANNEYDCPDTASIIITVDSLAVDLGADVTICNEIIILNAIQKNPASYSWSTGDITDTLSVSDEGEYWVVVASPYCQASDTIIVSTCSETVSIPKAFSPNGDGNNDVFSLLYQGNIEIEYFKIFNRWGKEIFNTYNPTEGWTGDNAELGLYLYEVVITQPTQKTKKGTFVLIN